MLATEHDVLTKPMEQLTAADVNELLSLIQDNHEVLAAEIDQMSEEALVEAWDEHFTENVVDICEHSFKSFCTYFLPKHFSSEFGSFHLEIIETLETLAPGRHLLALLPREHGKSTLIDFAYTIWNMCYRKKKHIGIVSTTAENAQKFLNKIRVELDNNLRIRYHFGDLVGKDVKGQKESWRVAHIKTTNQVIVFATAVGKSMRGTNESLPELLSGYIGRGRTGRPRYKNPKSFRPDLLIFDDVIEDKHIKTRNTRDSLYNWFWDVAFNVPDSDRGNIIVVGTAIHDDDLVMRLWKDKEQTIAWKKIKRPACEGFDNKFIPINPLWPEQWGKPDLNKPCDHTGQPYSVEQVAAGLDPKDCYYLSRLAWKRRELGSRSFSKEFLLKPFDDGTKYFDKVWYKYWISDHAYISEDQQLTLATLGLKLDTLPNDLIIVTSVDPATARGKPAEDADKDFTAIVTMGYSPSQRRKYVLDVDRGRYRPLDIIKLIFKHYQAYNSQFGNRFYTSGETNVGPYTKWREGRDWQHMGIVVESVAFQVMLAQMIDEVSSLLGVHAPVIEVKRGTKNKTARAAGVSASVERGEVYFPFTAAMGMQKDAHDQMQEELDTFPQAEYDDTVDGFVDCLSFLQGVELDLNRGLAAKVAIKNMVDSRPEVYAYVTRMADQGVDAHDALRTYHARPAAQGEFR